MLYNLISEIREDAKFQANIEDIFENSRVVKQKLEEKGEN